jgi:hypothetical protein
MGWTIVILLPVVAGKGTFVFATASRSALRPSQPSVQWVPRLKRSGREAHHSSSSLAEVKNAWSHSSILPIRHHGVVLN